jgi:flavin reductase (DIM6/NTAB) family NADH-FMN oxidoreductase RutF
MQLQPTTSNVVDVYHLLTGIVVPRPIAWVSTISSDGVANLAPFSFFNVFGANPPVVVFSPTLKRDGTKKDTLRNIEATGEFVIHSTVEALAETVNLTSKELPPEASEFDLAKLAMVPSSVVKPQRVAVAPTALECKVMQIIPTGTGPIAGNLVIGEVVMLHVNDALFDEAGRVDPRKLQAVARLGAEYWCKTADLFELKRP